MPSITCKILLGKHLSILTSHTKEEEKYLIRDWNIGRFITYLAWKILQTKIMEILLLNIVDHLLLHLEDIVLWISEMILFHLWNMIKKINKLSIERMVVRLQFKHKEISNHKLSRIKTFSTLLMIISLHRAREVEL